MRRLQEGLPGRRDRLRAGRRDRHGKFGAIVVATGYEPYDWREAYPDYGGGQYPDVITSLQYERMLSASGPTGGHVQRPSDGAEPKQVVFISCVGSRDESVGRPLCCSVGCMYIAKQAILTKEHIPDSQSYVFYIDIRATGKGYEEFTRRAQKEFGAIYLRGRVGKIYPSNGKLVVMGTDTLSGGPVEIEADLVVLATGFAAAEGAGELARKLNISYDQYEFLSESHPKLRPVETNTGGIFLAGACQGPKDIPDSVAQASAAAAKVIGLLSQGRAGDQPDGRGGEPDALHRLLQMPRRLSLRRHRGRGAARRQRGGRSHRFPLPGLRRLQRRLPAGGYITERLYGQPADRRDDGVAEMRCS